MALAQNRYGKSRVRLVRVKRHADRHDFQEWSVEILLQGDFESCFTDGDNSKILPTDTMKNTVYSLARDSAAACVEEFAQALAEFLGRRNPQVSRVEVYISQKKWEHLHAGGKLHLTTFVQSSGECQTTIVTRTEQGTVSVRSGLENLVIMKTSGSGFEGYLRDPLTTLPEMKDRLFGTAVKATWNYSDPAPAYSLLRANIRETLLDTFAGHESKSVQHTLHAMARAVLESVSEVDEIELAMPNKHCLLVDLSPFGQDNPNE